MMYQLLAINELLLLVDCSEQAEWQSVVVNLLRLRVMAVIERSFVGVWG
jgi:hypothetical protein